MGLYLCIFTSDDFDDDLDGIDVGGYDDFHEFRQAVCVKVEGVKWASRCPVLMNHSDSEGAWSPDQAPALVTELAVIQERFRQFPAPAAVGWKREAFRRYGKPRSLAEYFIDVDGEPLIERLLSLAAVAVQRGRPISFQ